jgi:hypothetical protein
MIAIPTELIDCDNDYHVAQELHDAASTALASSKYGPLRKLRCRVFEGVVEITGSVPSFYLKALAQAAVLQLYPSGAVRNLVRVSGESSIFVATSCEEPAGPAA